MSSSSHDKRRRIRWLYRLLDRAAARVDPNRLADHLERDPDEIVIPDLDDYPERRTLPPEQIPTQIANSCPDC